MRRILCIWLPNWAVLRRTLAQPELEGRPVVLWETRRNARRVAACCARAQALGVRLGMPVAEAAALAERRDVGRGEGRGERAEGGGQFSFFNSHFSICTLPSDPAGDRAALEELAVWCSRFSSAVGLEEEDPPESLLLDITGLEHLFGGEPAQAARVLAALARRGIPARIGVADAPGAAWAAARFGAALRPPSSALRPLPSALCSIIPPGRPAEALAPLPVESLRLPEETAELLHSLGVYRVGQLARLPRQDLAARFGPELARRLDQALGLLPEPIRACGAPPELRAEWALEYPTARREAAGAVLDQLVGQVAARLAEHGRGALRIECRLECQGAPAVRLSVGLYQASASGEHLAGLVRMQLERARLPAPVTAVRVEAAVSARLTQRQQSLLDEELARRRQDLAGLIDRLAARLGPRSVLRARLLADALPELAVCYDNLQSLSRPSPRSTPHAPRSTPHELPPRPLRLLARPAALVASSVLPEGPPVQFHFQGSMHRVARTWGPERIETGWWRGRTVGRDYYRVETAAGRRFWLFRRLRDGKWFLHGMFE